MELVLVERAATLIGWGADRGGVFTIAGAGATADGRVAWEKTYLGRHAVRYSGARLADRRMWGLWQLSGALGPWDVRGSDPAGHHDSTTVELELEAGLDAWLEGRHRHAAEAFEAATGRVQRADVAVAAASLWAHCGEIAAAIAQSTLAKVRIERDGTERSGVSMALLSLQKQLDLARFMEDVAARGAEGSHDDGDRPPEDRRTPFGFDDGDVDDDDALDPRHMNNFAWKLYTLNADLDRALSLARRSYELDRNHYISHTLCAILMRMGRWEEARRLFHEWMFGLGQPLAELRRGWADYFRATFEDVVVHGHAADAAALFDELGNPLPWLRDALLRAAQGEPFTLAWPEATSED